MVNHTEMKSIHDETILAFGGWAHRLVRDEGVNALIDAVDGTPFEVQDHGKEATLMIKGIVTKFFEHVDEAKEFIEDNCNDEVPFKWSLKNYNQAFRALHAHLCEEEGEQVDPDEIEEEGHEHWGLPIYSYYGAEYAVGNDEDCDKAAREYIEESLWAFNAEFIASHAHAIMTDKTIAAIKKMQEELCEDANGLVEALIDDMDVFVRNAIDADGRGHFLNPYDGEEHEQQIGNNMFFIYRTN